MGAPLLLISSLVLAASLRNTHKTSSESTSRTDPSIVLSETRDGAETGSQACTRMRALLEKRRDGRSKELASATLESACRKKRRPSKRGGSSEEEEPSYGCSLLRFSCQTNKTNLNTTVVEYPPNAAMMQAARHADAVSPRVFREDQLEGISWPDTIGSLAPLQRPTMPESGAPFWAEFDQITDMQHARRDGEMARDWMPLPRIFQNHTMEEGAEAVEADFPSKFPTLLVQQFLGEGVDFDEEIIPHATGDDFVNKQVMLARIIGWAIASASPTCFAMKWHEGRPRPEEVAWAIHNGDHRVDDAPEHVVDNVEYLNLQSDNHGFDYTAYTYGSPKHPSWPAMHSAASTASVYLPLVLNLTYKQMIEAQRLDCAVATFRSFAGVHYESDNMAGLTAGQEVVCRDLPDMLHRDYGSDKAKVKAKLYKLVKGGLFPNFTGHSWKTAPSCMYTDDKKRRASAAKRRNRASAAK